MGFVVYLDGRFDPWDIKHLGLLLWILQGGLGDLMY